MSAHLYPAPNEVHCWCVPLDVGPEVYTRLYRTLSPDERQRSARLIFERDHHRFIVARGVLRTLLGAALRIPAAAVRFEYNDFGKPALGLEYGRLKFNLSHSHGLALIAIASDAQVG